MTRLLMLLTTLSVTTLTLTSLVACAPDPAERAVVPIAPTPPPADDVSRVSRVALAVQSGVTPAAALKAEDITAAQLDGLLYDIAVDPAKSEEYGQALGR
ncbi:MAG: hypothetical protein RIT28_2777 [Pseudomonadota bacterium]|jgi:hypothetical protein